MGQKRTCVKYSRTDKGLRCVKFLPRALIGTHPCTPPGLIDGPYGRSPGLVRVRPDKRCNRKPGRRGKASRRQPRSRRRG